MISSSLKIKIIINQSVIIHGLSWSAGGRGSALLLFLRRKLVRPSFQTRTLYCQQNSKEVSKGALQIMLSRSVQVAGLDLFVSSRAASLRCQKYCARSPSNLKVSNPMHITQHGR